MDEFKELRDRARALEARLLEVTSAMTHLEARLGVMSGLEHRVTKLEEAQIQSAVMRSELSEVKAKVDQIGKTTRAILLCVAGVFFSVLMDAVLRGGLSIVP